MVKSLEVNVVPSTPVSVANTIQDKAIATIEAGEVDYTGQILVE